MKSLTPWGYLLSLDISRCSGPTIRSKQLITDFSRDLVKRIDMLPYGDPLVEWFGDGPRGGFTLVQLIHTSCITGHFCEESNNAYIDVFSCKPFEPDTVQQTINDYFKPLKIKSQFTTRDAELV